MRPLLVMGGVVALALSVVAVAVGVGHDTTVLVAPPESVVEPFARKLAGGRYDVALEHVEETGFEMARRIRADSRRLRDLAGAIEQVEGQPGAITGDTATASALITTEKAGDVTWSFRLVRRAGVWRITDWRQP